MKSSGLDKNAHSINICLNLSTSFYLQANDQLKRYDSLTNQCRSVSAQQDLNSFVKILQPESPPKVPKKSYVAPAAGDNEEVNKKSSQIVSGHLTYKAPRNDVEIEYY